MAEYTNASLQTVAANQNVVYTETPVKGSACIKHREGSGLVNLRGLSNNCFARFKVNYTGNIGVPSDGTEGAISVSLAIDGEPLSTSTAIVNSAAGELFNVSVAAIVDVPTGCCASIAIENTSTQTINVQNSSIIVERIA